jgi:hypothetical protein
MRFAPESLHDANNGLGVARELMEGVKKSFPWISYGDLWTLAGVAAIQVRPTMHSAALQTDLVCRKLVARRSPGVRDESTVLRRISLQMAASQMLRWVVTTFGTSSNVWGKPTPFTGVPRLTAP